MLKHTIIIKCALKNNERKPGQERIKNDTYVLRRGLDRSQGESENNRIPV